MRKRDVNIILTSFEIVIQVLSRSTEFLNCLRVLKEESLKSLQGSNYEEHHDFRESGRVRRLWSGSGHSAETRNAGKKAKI